MNMLAETVDVIIGVDTHKHTHSAAVVKAATGAEIDHDTQPADQAGYAALVDMADPKLARMWIVSRPMTIGWVMMAASRSHSCDSDA